MKAASSSNAEFRRLSLADQIATNLREAIRSGQLSERLPPERELCQMFTASRPIIRQALHSLRDQGVLRISRARRPEIVQRVCRNLEKGEDDRVVMLFVEPRKFVAPWLLMVIDEIRKVLYSQGFHFDLVMESGVGRKNPDARLRKLVDQHRSKNWILAGAPATIQEWFHAQPLNVVSMGNAFPQTHIPFVNDDLRGVTRHAVGVFLGLGHRRIAYLVREEGLAGEAKEEAGFLEGIRSDREAEGLVIKHSGRLEVVRDRLQGIFSRRPTVTALLVSHAEDTLVAVNWFLERGIRVPHDVSLISFQWESYLERIRPRPAWYYTDPKLHARKLCRLVTHPARVKKSPHLIIPTFFKNGAVAGAPRD